MARWAEDDEFNGWVARLRGDGPERDEIPDPDAMTLEMPEIPVAGAELLPLDDEGQDDGVADRDDNQRAEPQPSLGSGAEDVAVF